jgi:hypothetical protein
VIAELAQKKRAATDTWRIKNNARFDDLADI